MGVVILVNNCLVTFIRLRLIFSIKETYFCNLSFFLSTFHFTYAALSLVAHIIIVRTVKRTIIKGYSRSLG